MPRIGTDNCDKCIPKSLALRGYLGVFRQYLTGDQVEFDEEALIKDSLEQYMNMKPFPDRTFVVNVARVEPFCFAFCTDRGPDGEEEFAVWGPTYSVVATAAERLNYR